jgi:hypothetical protein
MFEFFPFSRLVLASPKKFVTPSPVTSMRFFKILIKSLFLDFPGNAMTFTNGVKRKTYYNLCISK